MDELTVEEKKLKEVLKVYREVIKYSKGELDLLPERYKDDPVMMYNLSRIYVTKIESLERNYKKPYFARIDFKANDEKEEKKCYIGKVGVIDKNNNIVTIDWRAPIASIYYDSSLGKTSYEAPDGKITGNLTLKRQYTIEDGKLISFRDVDLVSTDEILEPYLNSNADNRLKNIVASIQTEQNEIIRQKINKNLIIQGVAGSGKTTVALHRIAYLVYNYIKNIKPEQYMVIGPNKFFVNYISSVLPDLDVNNVSQLTYDEVVQNILNEKFKFVSSTIISEDQLREKEEKYRKFKGKMNFKSALDKYVKQYIESIFGGSDLEMNQYVLLKGSVINEIYEKVKNEYLYKDVLNKQIDRVILLASKYIEDHYDSIRHNLWEQYIEKTKNSPKNDQKVEMEKYKKVKLQLSRKCKNELKRYFKKAYPKVINLYIDFLNNLEEYIDIPVTEFDSFIQTDVRRLKSKKVEFEDLAPLLYLKSSINNVTKYKDLMHVVIDEAQDLGEFSFYALKTVMPKATFSIFGDLAQSIYQYRSIDDWDEVKTTTFDDNCEIQYLLKSYRNTYEIISSANAIINHIDMKAAVPVIRHGKEVRYEDNDKVDIDMIVDFIIKSKEQNYKSIAIITKNEKEARKIHKNLLANQISIDLISSKNTEYNSGVCILPCSLAKGLEFDSVLISDASENMYNSNNINDMKLLYVAMTRALHELTILHNGELTVPLKDDSLKNEKKNIIKKTK